VWRSLADQSPDQIIRKPQFVNDQPTDLDVMQAAPASVPSTTSVLVGIAPWLLIFVIFYVLMIRPQQQRVKQHQAATNAVKKGDDIITGGGIRGRVTKVSDDEAEVEIAQGVKIRVIKSTISQVLTPNANPAND
jgi:preprotein translocase subunit YajC